MSFRIAESGMTCGFFLLCHCLCNELFRLTAGTDRPGQRAAEPHLPCFHCSGLIIINCCRGQLSAETAGQNPLPVDSRRISSVGI